MKTRNYQLKAAASERNSVKLILVMSLLFTPVLFGFSVGTGVWFPLVLFLLAVPVVTFALYPAATLWFVSALAEALEAQRGGEAVLLQRPIKGQTSQTDEAAEASVHANK